MKFGDKVERCLSEATLSQCDALLTALEGGMRLVVIESPYAGDVELNLRYLDACIRQCIAKNESPYASHKMLTTALDDNDPRQRKIGIEVGLAWRRMAHQRVFYTDLGWSRGMEHARDLYHDEGLSYDVRLLGEGWTW